MKRPGAMTPFVMGMLWRKPATAMYPYKKVTMPDRFRGKLKFEQIKCIGCKMCERDCPANAIEIVKVGEKIYDAYVYLDRCIYCGQCVDSCPRKALENTKDFELANYNHENLKVKI